MNIFIYSIIGVFVFFILLYLIIREIQIQKRISKPDVWDRILHTTYFDRRNKAIMWIKAERMNPENPYMAYNQILEERNRFRK